MAEPPPVYHSGDTGPPLELAFTRRQLSEPLTGITVDAVVVRPGQATLHRAAVVTDVDGGVAVVRWQAGDLHNDGSTDVVFDVYARLTNAGGEGETSPDPVRVTVRPAVV